MKKTNPSNFYLSKWYADVIDNNTNNLIIYYWAELQWQGLNLHFSNLLQFIGLKKRISTSSFAKSRAPLLVNSILSIENPTIKGTWTTQTANISQILLENEQGYILWECTMPIANTNLQAVKNQSSYIGLGYVEKLTFSIKPWEMPIQILHWGRFLFDNQYIIWIRWEGKEQKNLLFHNGEKQANPYIDEHELHFGHFHLDLSEKYTLRNGSLISTIFKRFTWLKKIFPQRILNLQECKWQTKAVLTHQGQKISENWAIHEKVEWI